MIKIAIASGKGGTGKTTIATNLAAVLSRAGIDVAYLDCDVEEPNGHIFLAPDIEKNQGVDVPVPSIDLDKCDYCGLCSEICQYNAIAALSDNVMVFPSLCHGCGGCTQICPRQAITEVPRQIGEIRYGHSNGIQFIDGRLQIGEAISPPITRQLKANLPSTEVILIDAPPGTSCSVIEAVKDTDYVILVTEPTPFGLNDLKLAVEMLKLMELPFGVIINRADIGDNQVELYCKTNRIEVLMRIPFDRATAEMYSRGELAHVSDTTRSEQLYSVYKNIAGQVEHV